METDPTFSKNPEEATDGAENQHLNVSEELPADIDFISEIESDENLPIMPELNQEEYYPPNFPKPVRIDDDDSGFSQGNRIQKRNVHNPSIIFNVSSEDNGHHQENDHIKIAEDADQPNADLKIEAEPQTDKQLQIVSDGKNNILQR